MIIGLYKLMGIFRRGGRGGLKTLDVIYEWPLGLTHHVTKMTQFRLEFRTTSEKSTFEMQNMKLCRMNAKW